MQMMTFKEVSQNIISEFDANMSQFTKKDWAWTTVLILIIIWGSYALYKQIAEGHGVTGMRDHVVWGLYIANFIFFIGISYAGAIISALLHFSKLEWGKPIIRIAKLTTLIAVFIGPIYILLCVGRFDRLHYLFVYSRLQSPIFWDVIAICTFFVGSLIFLYLSLIKDFAILSVSKVNVGAKRKRLYQWLSLGYQNTPQQRKKINSSLNIIGLIMIPLVVVVSSVLSWIFGMTLRPGWHSTIFGPYFVLAAMYTGTGVIIVLMYLFKKIYHLHDYIIQKHFHYMGYVLLVLAAAYGYFTFSEYLTDWYTSKKWNSDLISKLFNWDEFAPLFLFANVGGIIIPILVISISRLRTIGWITIASSIMILSMWVKRYLIVIPTLETTLIPMQDTRQEYIHYSATWIEWALTAAGIAAFILMFRTIAKFIPIFSVWDATEYVIKSKNGKTEPYKEPEILTNV